MTMTNYLNFCSWNIHGFKSRQLGNKLHDENFLNIIKDQDFISLTETHIHDEILEDLSIPGYKRVQYKNRKKNLRSHTAAGVIAVFVKNHISNLFTPVKTDDENTIWVKIKKEMTKAGFDVYVGTHYMSPSKTTNNKTLKLIEDINLFQSKGIVIINGDFNARTGTENDIISPDKFDNDLGIEIETFRYKRNSQDVVRNKAGEDLIDMCKSLDLCIVNGRKVGDPFGNYTCIKWNGNSTIDYLITPKSFFNQVLTFKVGKYEPLISDHRPLKYCLEIQKYVNDAEKKSLDDAPRSFIWSDEGITKFLNNLKNDNNQNYLDTILNSDFSNPNAIVEDITNFLTKIAKTSNIKMRKIRNSTGKVNPPWFNNDCTKIKNKIVSLGTKITKDPNNPDLKIELTKEKKSLKNIIKRNKLSHKEAIMQQMKLSNKQSKKFWKLLSKLESSRDDHIFIKGISADKWKTHFKNVLHNPKAEEPLPPNTVVTGPLDFEITPEEIDTGAYILRKGKAPGFDNISNEMILCVLKTKPEILLKLFNSILKNPSVIDKWNVSMISQIHKKGTKSNPDNYRGISLLSSFYKFFCAILNIRLMTFAIDKQLLSKSQLGFVPGNRTSDALMILYNLIDYYCHKNQHYMYGCFVDFSKAFDTIPRKKLFQKLLDNSINGKFYDCLTMFYNNDKVHVKIGTKITSSFQANQGVKQGCILSPLLFNIFLSDLQAKIDAPEHHAPLLDNDHPISCLIWADDLLLLSRSESGLSKMLQNLNEYTSTNGMHINIDKTKVMTFNRTGKLLRKSFYLGEHKLETVKEYKYLGFMVTPRGGIETGLKDLKDRAMKAFYKMKHQLGPQFRKHPLITIKLFETLIQPILLYSSDFWGILKQPRNNPIEIMHMKFCKELLGVQRQTTNAGVLLELGQIPLSIRGIKHAIKNWTRIYNDGKCNELLQLSIKNCTTHNLTWAKQIEHTLSTNGMYDVFLSKSKDAHLSIFQRLQNVLYQITFSDIKKETSKLRTYSFLKTTPGFETYLSEIQNIDHRITLTKFRLSNHSLKIETGRHDRIEKTKRFCPFCPNQIEDEKHALLQCKTYNKLRIELFRTLEINTMNQGNTHREESLFTLLLSLPHFQISTAKYLHKLCI